MAPFRACFDSRTIGKTVTGPNVSTIDLVLKGGFQWRIYGANSMVKVAKNVLCLAFVDGGFGAMKFHCNFDCHWWVSDGGQSFGV